MKWVNSRIQLPEVPVKQMTFGGHAVTLSNFLCWLIQLFNSVFIYLCFRLSSTVLTNLYPWCWQLTKVLLARYFSSATAPILGKIPSFTGGCTACGRHLNAVCGGVWWQLDGEELASCWKGIAVMLVLTVPKTLNLVKPIIFWQNDNHCAYRVLKAKYVSS